MRVLILICIVAAAYASQECGENAHYAECGTACPLTCDNYQNPPRMCIMMCYSGCQCDKGYVKASDGSCVRPEQCPTKSEEVCGENAHWESCGTACPLTCDNYENPPKICVLSCNIGCHCDQGYVKTSDGRCVKPEQCRSKTTLPAEKSCTDKADPGMCLAYIPSWFYNTATGKCEQFIYGGCQGNGNRYSSEEECQQHCQASQRSPLSLCLEEKVTGPCRGYIKRFYYNQESGKCEQFVYGGCGGNNFESEELCNSVCVD